MVQFAFLGDSNLFYQDTQYHRFPWNHLYEPHACTASLIADKLGVPYYAFPLYRMELSWDNTTRLQSLIMALSRHDTVHLIIWIGQNDAWKKANSTNEIGDNQTRVSNMKAKVLRFT